MAISAAVIGLGYWGPNLCRNLAASQDFDLVAVCDQNPHRLDRIGAHYPATRRYADAREMLAGATPELVAIATPVASHAPLARMALEAGSHVLVEKPLAATSAEAEALMALARDKALMLFVDHTFLFTGAVQELKRQIEGQHLGDLLYVDSVRINLGLFQPDVDVIWDLAPHDLSILQYAIGRMPETVQAMGSSHNPQGFCDVAYLHLDYGSGLTAHLHLSWLSPVKVRRMIFAGSRQSLIFDDLEPAEKVKIYDHGVAFNVADDEERRQVLVSYRKGDMRAPAIPASEALGVELTDIAQTLRGECKPLVPGAAGLEVVRILEAAGESLRRLGAIIRL